MVAVKTKSGAPPELRRELVMTELSTGSFSLPPLNRISPQGRQSEVSATSLSGKYHLMLLNALLRIADIVILVGTCVLLLSGGHYPMGGEASTEIILLVLLTQLFFQEAGLYRRPRPHRPASFIPTLSFTWLAVGVAVVGLHFLSNVFDNVPLGGSFACFGAAFVGFSTIRLMAFRRTDNLYDIGRMALPVAVVGTRNATRWLERCLSQHLGTAIELVATFDLKQAQSGPASELFHLCRTGRISEILIAVDGQVSQEVDTLLQKLSSLAITVRLVPRLTTARPAWSPLQEIYGAPTIPVIRPPLTDMQAAVKRCFDLLASSVALFLFAPLFLFIAILIKIDSPGPVLFRQERWGINARRITVLKFRTMFIEADPDPKVMQARRADPRVSRIGRFLRRSSLDELPQLLNVLLGNMSLVGPRPHASAHNEFYASRVENYLNRHRLKPGITGLAQVNGCRGETDTIDKMQRRVVYDLQYVERWSLSLDLKIILKTALVGFLHPNAY
jgi:Undecaprenyl-phosphate glucose phosphotransferase